MHALQLIIAFHVCATLTWLLNWLALIPWRRAAGAHWTEQARRLHPARVGARLNQLGIPTLLWLWFRWRTGADCPPFLGVFAAGWVGTWIGSYAWSAEVFPWLKFRDWLRELLGMVVLLAGSWALLFAGFKLMPPRWDWTVWAWLGVLSAVQIWFAGWGVLAVARALRLITPAPPALVQQVECVAARQGVPVRGVWLLHSSMANAFAFPLTGELVFTRRLVETQPAEEIAAICAHELGHLSEPRGVLLVRILGSLAFLPLILVAPVANSFGSARLVWLLGASLAILLGTRWMARRMEVRADAAATAGQAGEGVYARALENLYRTNLMPAVMPGRRQVHPHLYDRLVAAGITPDYPRPKAASGLSLPSLLIVVAVVVLSGLNLLPTSPLLDVPDPQSGP